ncbi:MAG: nucleotide exchange factor GrpE [Coriobacteriia bacterium]|nr:nucleotide exchange factor GrpE [Coriobacteriia bacterium]
MSKRDNDRIDSGLESDLGAEFDLRGDQLQEELGAAREDAARHLEAAQRVQAEFENFRKRNLREVEEIRKRAGQRIIEELLPILDNLERAIEHTVAGGDLEHLLKGVELVQQQVIDVFCKEGVEILDPFGQPFDPNIHQAVGQREDAEVPEGTVVDVFQKGYLLGGRVVRPAAVVVSAGGPAPKE